MWNKKDKKRKKRLILAIQELLKFILLQQIGNNNKYHSCIEKGLTKKKSQFN